MFSDAPPCLEQLVISFTCCELVLVKILENSGINAPAAVPQEMIAESTHHKSGLQPALFAQQKIAGDERDENGNGRGDPDQLGQRRFKIEILQIAVSRAADRVVDKIRGQRGRNHQRAHREQPDDERGANDWIGRQRQREKRDQRHAGHAVGFKAVRRRADRIARVVAGAIGDDAGIFWIIFRAV